MHSSCHWMLMHSLDINAQKLSLDVNAQQLSLDVNAQQLPLDVNAQQLSLDSNHSSCHWMLMHIMHLQISRNAVSFEFNNYNSF